jgi:excinuclease ABC subunit A
MKTRQVEMMIKYIEITGAKEHNLKGFDITIPHNKLIVVTGVSGSGKSSLAYDIVFREGQRRYLESINSYTRQFMDKAGRPTVGSIKGIRPAIAVGQNSLHRNSRSTVGTLTGIYDYLRLLFARYGQVETGSETILKRSLFSFNSKYGACEHCKGLGVVDEIDAELLIKDERLTIREGAFEMTTPSGYIVYSQVTMDVLDQVCAAHGFSVDVPWKELSEAEKLIVLYGSEQIKVPFGKHTLESRMKWSGITARPREEGYYKGIMTIMTDILLRDRNTNILRFARTITCPQCEGKRLRAEALKVQYKGRNISEYSEMSLRELAIEFKDCAAGRGAALLLNKISKRCQTGCRIGLGHLPLNRGSETLSAGEGQRLKILILAANQMREMVYVFDEPSIGLHQSEIGALLGLLYELRDNGNTVLVVEHDPLIINAADHLIAIGPGAGRAGGNLLHSGRLTAEYLFEDFELNENEQPAEYIEVAGARANNLQGIEVKFALKHLNVITGVSGAGKTSLAEAVLLPGLKRNKKLVKQYSLLKGGETVSRIVKIDQKPIGRSPRSNAATYTGLMDDLRAILAKQPQAVEAGLGRSAFSFNTKGGRCEECEGAGVLKLGMHFLDDITMVCPRCNGNRFKPEILKVKWKGYNIAELLELSVSELRKLLEQKSKGGRILQVLEEVGLGYLSLGQPATTISGGEAQRIKLATELAKPRKSGTLYYLDEPTTGLHAFDVAKLLKVLENLVVEGNTVIVIEHDPQVIYRADRVIDLGDGKLLYEGSVKGLLSVEGNLTAQALRGEIVVENKPGKDLDKAAIEFHKVTTNNLKSIDVSIPRGKITAITGISGSGKSSLAFDTIYAEGWQRYVENLPAYSGSLLASGTRGDLESFSGLGAMLAIKQQNSVPNRRSTLGTFSGIYDHLRLLFSRLGVGARLPASDFSFNNPAGACENCKGLGTVLSCDPYLLITHPERSIYDGAMDGTKRGKYYGERQGQYLATLRSVEQAKGENYDRSWKELSEAERDVILYGTGEQKYEVIWNFERGNRLGEHNFSSTWQGFVNLINIEYERVHQKRAGEQMRNLLSENQCPVCEGSRLQKRILDVKIAGYNIAELCNLEISELAMLFRDSQLAEKQENPAAWRIFAEELVKPLKKLVRLGLGYLTPGRRLNTLSGGEYQRLRIGRQLVSGLTGVTFVLDEVSRGLHFKERRQVYELIRELADNGNTVICVEHDPLFINAADHVIELGPGAGRAGGRIIASGSPEELVSQPDSMISKYLQNEFKIQKRTRTAAGYFEIKGAYSNNLQNIDARIPTGLLVGICGVSGSGKSTLCREVIYMSYLRQQAMGCDKISGLANFDRLIYLKQSRFNKNALSTTATYLAFLKDIGKLIAAEHAVKAACFNYAGKQGQCPECKGIGYKREELDFAGSIRTECELCGGSRYKAEVLQYKYKDKSIAEILDMTITEAALFFADKPKLAGRLQEMISLGLGYLQLGQGSDTLSGGESQRLMLAGALQERKTAEKCLILLDEPTSGLHPADIDNLSHFLVKLIEKQHSVIFVEHNRQLLAEADHLIELGPGGGKQGGKIVRIVES